MNITHKYSADEGCVVAINNSNQSHANATIKSGIIFYQSRPMLCISQAYGWIGHTLTVDISVINI